LLGVALVTLSVILYALTANKTSKFEKKIFFFNKFIKMFKIQDIPKYLHNSDFYLNLDPLDEEFEIPEQYYKEDENINSFEYWIKLFNIYEFFGIHEIPVHVKKYQHQNVKQVANYLLSNKEHANNSCKIEDLLSTYKYIPGNSVYGLDLNGFNLFVYLSEKCILITKLNLEIKMKIETIKSYFSDKNFINLVKENKYCSYKFKSNGKIYLIEYKNKLMRIKIIGTKEEYIFEYNY